MRYGSKGGQLTPAILFASCHQDRCADDAEEHADRLLQGDSFFVAEDADDDQRNGEEDVCHQ